MKVLKKGLISLGFNLALLAGTNTLAAWTDAESISANPCSLNPTPSCLTIDQNSNAIVGWLNGSVGTENSLSTASLPAGAPHWNDPITLFTGTSPQYATFPILFADNIGIVHAEWATFTQEGSLFDQMTFMSTSQNTLGTAWPEPITSSTLSGFPANGAGEVDELGDCIGLVALSSDSNTYAPPYSINMMTLTNAETAWNPPLNLGTDNGASSPVLFGSTSHGSAIIGWRIAPTLKTARYNFATNTLTPMNDIFLPSGTTDIGFARSALSSNGDTTLVFGLQIGVSSNNIIYSTFLPADSDTWTVPKILSDPNNNTTGQFLSIKADNSAKSYILWGELTPENNAFIKAVSLTFGGTLSDIQNLTDPNPSAPITGDQNSGLMLDLDAFGNAVAIWQFYVDGVPTVQVASRPNVGSWSAVHTLSTSGGTPNVAVSDQGTAVAVWLDSASNFVYASRSDHLFALAPPSGFGGYISHNGSNFILHTYWDQSYAPNIVNYELFKDGVLIASIASDEPYTNSHNLPSGTLDGEYTIVGTASNGNKSTPLTLTLVE